MTKPIPTLNGPSAEATATKAARNAKMREQRAAGMTLAQIGRLHGGLSKQAVALIVGPQQPRPPGPWVSVFEENSHEA